MDEIRLTKSQQKRIDYIKSEGYEVSVKVVYGSKISVVAKKNPNSIYNYENYHIFIGARGAVEGVSCGNVMTFDTHEERREHERVLLSLFFFKVFGYCHKCKVRIIG